MPTLVELTNADAQKTDGLSFAATLFGRSGQQSHSHLYWEYRGQRAVRMQEWKAYRAKNDKPWELYNLAKDIEEQHNVASEHPDVVNRLAAHAQAAHEPIRPGQVYDRAIIQKDRRQAPHNRKPKSAK